MREARPEEYEAAAAVGLAAYRGVFGAMDDDLTAMVAGTAERASQAHLLVAVDDERVVGTATYVDDPASPLWEWAADDSVAGIRMMAVDPRWQGRGTGRALLSACLERARAAGLRKLALHSETRMTTAHRLYEATGFVRRPEHDWEPEPGMTLLYFELDL